MSTNILTAKAGVGPLSHAGSNDVIETDDSKKASMLNEYFSSVLCLTMVDILNYLVLFLKTHLLTRNRKHRRAAAKPAACAEPLMLSTPATKGKRGGSVR